MMHQDIIFCHLEKCAGTFIGRMLKLLQKRTGRKYMWVGHDINDSTRKIMGNMMVLGNIRNPYSYYVSLWAFSGIHKKGHYDIIASKFPEHLYLYSDPYNIPNFRKWLKLMVTGLLQEDFAKHMVKYNIGLLTSRFFELYNDCDFSLLNNVDVNPMVHYFIRLENLKEDLNKINLPYVHHISNRSQHHHYSLYYGEEERDLVYKLDNYIFKKFGYQKECKNG